MDEQEKTPRRRSKTRGNKNEDLKWLFDEVLDWLDGDEEAAWESLQRDE